MLNDALAGRHDGFSDRPFRRAVALQALFARLSMPERDWCCVDADRLPGARTEPVDVQLEQPLRPHSDAEAMFFRFCSRCHETNERFPPNFLAGGAERVRQNLAHCAERIGYRLSMWRTESARRDKTPMPPELAVASMYASNWTESAELAMLKQYVGVALASQGSDLAAILNRPYESLRSCL
jgi:hypothetical protein